MSIRAWPWDLESAGLFRCAPDCFNDMSRSWPGCMRALPDPDDLLHEPDPDLRC